MLVYELLQRLLFALLARLAPRLGSLKFRRFMEMRDPDVLHEAVTIADWKRKNADSGRPVVWFHVASAGELEQAIPVARALADTTGARFFLTYFSPSAEPFLKNFPGLLAACGFPPDLRAVHASILSTLEVRHVILVRYDLWPGLLAVCHQTGTPASLLAATSDVARSSSLLGFWKHRLLRRFHHIFVVREKDVPHFGKIAPASRVLVAGDSKWWRARERAEKLRQQGRDPRLHGFGAFCRMQKDTQKRRCYVFGSPHAEEHEIALRLVSVASRALVVYAPHDLTEANLGALEREALQRGWTCRRLSHLAGAPSGFEGGLPETHSKNRPGTLPRELLQHRLADELPASSPDSTHETMGSPGINFIVVDAMGLLAEIYSFADVAIVGGGFDGQLHNVLEPAAHPVVTAFGGNLKRAAEARALVEREAALSFTHPQELFLFLVSCASEEGEQLREMNSRLARVKLHALECFRDIPDTGAVVSGLLAPTLALPSQSGTDSVTTSHWLS